jgi:hypothetical protein
MRGYDGSALFKEDAATSRSIADIMARDFVAIVTYLVERLHVLCIPGSSLTIFT